MQTKLPFFGTKKEKENKAPTTTAVSAGRIKSVWDRLHNINNKTDLYNFQAQYGKLPEKITQINQDQALKLNMWANSKVVSEELLKRYTELREDAFLMDYIDRYKDEVNEAGMKMNHKSDDTLDQSYKADHIAAESLTNDVGKDNWVDDEGRHAKMQLQKATEYSIKLSKMLDDMEQLPSWVQEKITKASDYMSTVYHYLDYEISRSEDDLEQNMDNFITEVKKKLKEAPEDELGPPTTKHPTPSKLAITLNNLGLSGNTIDSVKVVQTNIPTYKITLINGEGFYLKHYNEEDPFIAVIGFKEYNMEDITGNSLKRSSNDLNMAKDAINILLTQDQFKGLGGDEEGGEGGDDLGGDEPPVDEPAEEPEL